MKNILLYILALLSLLSCGGKKGAVRDETVSKKQLLTDWRFQPDIFDIGVKEKWYSERTDKSAWSRVKIPAAWDTYDKALWGYEGAAWYYTVIGGGAIDDPRQVFLKFNRVNYFSSVWLNGKLIAENSDGFLPFEVNISGCLNREKENFLVVRADNRPDLNHLPAARQIEWVQYGGILQDVELIRRNKVYIKDAAVISELEGEDARLKIIVNVADLSAEQGSIAVDVTVKNSSVRYEKRAVYSGGDSLISIPVEITVPKAELWSVRNPNLYSAETKLFYNGEEVDRNLTRFGIRTVKTDGRKILLNNRPLYFKGVNRYDILGRSGYETDEKVIREDLLKIKDMGVNVVRVHYPQSPLTLNIMDEIGLMLIEELPLNWWGQNWWDDKPAVQDTFILAQARRVLKKMILRDKNHPCIIAWSLANESRTDTEIGEYVIRKLIKDARLLDKTRLITFTVNDEAGKHKAFEAADYVSCNIYFGNDNAYHAAMMDSLVRQPAENMIRKQAAFYPDKPLIVSEFGAAGIYSVHGDVIFSEDWQGEYIKQMWAAIHGVSECSGGILWSWRDYFHRKYFTQPYAPFGPYGVLNADNKEKISYTVLKRIFKRENKNEKE
jgi:beta-glucuronidase